MGVGGSDSGGTKRTQQIENENEDDDEKDCSKHRASLKMVDAMVLSGCRICGNLTYEDLHIEGGTHRQCKPSNEQQPIG
jgi:hypothetical protein